MREFQQQVEVKIPQQQNTNEMYQNKLMNKNIPEFFIKKNNFDPIYIKPLSVVENHKKVLKVVKLKDQVLIPNFKRFQMQGQQKPEM
jgi:hypothetical protein